MNTNVTSVVRRLVEGLKSRNEEGRVRALHELYKSVDRELKEVSIQSYVLCLDMLCSEILNMYTTGDLHEKKGAVAAMCCLTEVDFMNVHHHCRRFASHLLNRSPSTDIQLAALEARLIGQFSLVFPCDFVEDQIKRACESLLVGTSDPQKQFSLLLLRELVLNAPSSFHQQFGLFISAILSTFRDKNITTRELATLALRPALTLAAAREQRRRLEMTSADDHPASLFGRLPLRQSEQEVHIQFSHSSGLTTDQFISSVAWYRSLLTEAFRQFNDTSPTNTAESQSQPSVHAKKLLNRDDWIHGSMLLMTELLTSVVLNHEELLTKLDEMAGLPLFEFLAVQQPEVTQAIRSVTSLRWSEYNGSSLCHANPLLPDIPILPVKEWEAMGSLQLKPSTPPNAISSLCHRMLVENIDELWKAVLPWLKSKNQQLVTLLFKLLPRLIALKPSYLESCEKQRPLLEWLFQYANREREKPVTILCIALIGYHLGPEFLTCDWLPQLFTLIRSCLPSPRDPPTKKRSAQLETAAILAVGISVMSLGSSIYEQVKQIVDSLVACGLTQPLVATFKMITDHIPQLRREIKDQILSDINLVLLHNCPTDLNAPRSSLSLTGLSVPLTNISNLLSDLSVQCAASPVVSTSIGNSVSTKFPPAPAVSSSGAALVSTSGPNTPICTNSTMPDIGTSSVSGVSGISRLVLQATGRFHALRRGSYVAPCTNPTSPELHTAFPSGAHTSGELSSEAAVVALALKTLGSFDFEGRPLAHFIQHISDNFISVLTCDVKEIRLEAVKTCARLMLPWLKCVDSHHWYARPAMNTVTDRLGKLLTVGISDPDPDVRRCVFESIDPGFDTHLSQEEHLSSLFLALQDEQFAIQCLVMRRLGRLSEMNPACVQPGLRKVLLRTLDTLAHSGSTKNKEQSALLIACMISSAPRFFAPYAEPVLQVLIPRIKQTLPATLRRFFCGPKTSQSVLASSLFDTGKTDCIVLTVFGDNLPETQDTTTSADRREPPLKDRPSALNLPISCDVDPPGYPRPLGGLFSIKPNHLGAIESEPCDIQMGHPTSDLSAQWMEPTSVVIALFTTLGKLSAVAPAAVRRHLHEFVPVLCSMLQDPSCFPRRSIAIWTLSTLVSNTGYVVSPYQRHPYLLPLLLHMLKNEESKDIRQEILRALGVLGALDPFKYKLYTGQVDTFSDTGIAVSLHETEEKKDVDITHSELVVSLSWENQEVFSSVCALSALIHLLRDSAMQTHCASIVKTIVYVLDQLGSRAVYYQRQLMPDYFNCLRCTRDFRLQEFLIRQLGSIMLIVRLHTKEFASEVVDALLSHWWVAPNVQNACIRLLNPMSSVLGAEFHTHLTRLIPVILRTLQYESTEGNLIALLEILPQFGYCLEDHAHILVPAIANLADITNETSLSVLLRSALDITPKTASATSDVASIANLEYSDDFADTNFELSASDVISTQQLNLKNDSMGNPLGMNSSDLLPVNVTSPTSSNMMVTSSTSSTNQSTVGSVYVKRACLDCLALLTDRVDLEEMCSQIVHPICRLLLTLQDCLQQCQLLTSHSLHHHHSTKPSGTLGVQSCTNAIQFLHPAAMDVLTGLLQHMGRKFKPFLPLVQKMITTLRIQPTRFYTVLGLIEKGAYLSTTDEHTLTGIASSTALSLDQNSNTKEPDPSMRIKVFETRGIHLERAWRSSRLMNRDDWDQWLKTLTAALLRESPNPSIRACSQLVSVTPAIGRTLFNAAFVSCWPKLTAPQQDCLISKLEEVLLVPDQSPEVTQAILNLEEFMAHVAKYSSTSTRVPLLLSLRLLADRAMKNRAYAKALYYKEQEFLEEVEKRSSPSQDTLSCLLTIYSKLQLEEAATGVLLYATRNPHDKLANEEVWREKLQDWKCALNLYENKLKDDRIRDKTPLILGRMRCLRALGQWAPLNTMVTRYWDKLNDSGRVQMAPLACTAAWAVNEWTQMERYASVLPTDQSFDGAFYRAVLNIHSDRCGAALQCIQKARNVLDADLTTIAGESYDRAYADLIGTQLLSEAEEVIQYKLVPERRPVLRDAWRSRIRGCQSVVEDWSQIIQLRSLVLQPRDDLKTWLRFAGLCRRSGRFTYARQLLQSVLGQDPALSPQNEPIPNSDPFTVFAYTKLLWATGANEEAVTRLCVLVTHVLEPLLNVETPQISCPRPFASVLDASEVLDNFDPRNTAAQAALERQELRTLMAKCCLRLGAWYSELYARCPPNSFTSDSIHTPTSTPTLSTSATQDSGLQHSVATANRLSKNREPSFRSVPGSDVGQMHTTRSNGSVRPATADGDHSRKSHCSHPYHSGLFADGTVVNVPQAWDERQGFVIQCYDAATKHAPENRLAWQSWAMTNYDVFKHLDALKAHIERAELELTKVGTQSPAAPHSSAPPMNTSTGNISPSAQTIADLWNAKTNLQLCMELHAAPSVRGFINSISLSPSANLQDSLRLINLLFKFGHLAEIRDIIREGLTKIRLSNWLLVIQQLLARIDTPRDYVASIIIDLLISVGRSYPQPLVYPLVLAFKSGGSDRRRYNANRILYSMEEHSPRLVSEAFLLNEELIRLSITWVEMWSESLEDASRVYFGEKDILKMFRILHPLHQMIDRGHETIHEAAFLQEHGNELNNCRICCETYERTSNKLILQQAWEGYYTLYRRFTKQVNSMTTLELCVSSPRLHEYGKDWELAVPGSYEPNRPLVRIAGIRNCLSLMTSKQHPRKLIILGSDGHQYVFLLKGHEDTRQDERVMQFFGLVNTLLMNNSDTLARNLTIQRMSVVPLSTNTGLIGWVPNSDTLHSLIRDYREKTQTMLNKENREMIALAPDFDRLNVIQKTEVFEAGLRECSGRDLANILWLKSHSSEAWFERRTNFVRSMATMSMVGYILGLGDRHPSNIMLSRETGKVVHIDFGDCFEVAMMREKFPEKVPFRLTRMIIAAMEVTGIDGVYRQTCHMVMSLMRSSRDSLLAVLEAFIHDPLLQWVLLESRKDFNQLDQKSDEGVDLTAQLQGNAAIAVLANGNSALPPGVQQTRTNHKHGDHHYHRPNMGAQTTAAYRPTDRTGGLAPHNSSQLQCTTLDYQQYRQPYQFLLSKRVFTNPNHPDSLSLRDPYKVNPWRHHLCNGPWFGCYKTAKRLRKQTETGGIIVERQGLQGFIFSAKPPANEDPSNVEAESQPTTLGNNRARVVMARIRQKLTGMEREQPMDVPSQVDYLVREATSNQNLCQMYIGWCAFW